MENSIITKCRKLFGCIIIVLLITYGDSISAYPTYFSFPPNNNLDIGRAFVLKEIEDINQINVELDSVRVQPNDQNPYSSICFDMFNEKQIDSAIKQISDYSLINEIIFEDCPIKEIPSSVKSLWNLYSIRFVRCDSIVSMNGFNSTYPIFRLDFNQCRISKLPDGIEKFRPFLRLILVFPNDFEFFNIDQELYKFVKRNNILDLYIKYNKLSAFPESIFKLNSLQTLLFYSEAIENYPAKYDKLNNLCYLLISSYDDRIDESAKMNSSFISNYRIRAGELDSSCNELISSLRLEIPEHPWIQYQRECMIAPLAPDGLIRQDTINIEIDGKLVIVNRLRAEQKLNIVYPELNKTDKITVEVFDSQGNFLFEGVRKEYNVLDVDLSRLPFGEYLIKININSYSKKIHLRKLSDPKQ